MHPTLWALSLLLIRRAQEEDAGEAVQNNVKERTGEHIFLTEVLGGTAEAHYLSDKKEEVTDRWPTAETRTTQLPTSVRKKKTKEIGTHAYPVLLFLGRKKTRKKNTSQKKKH